MRESKLLDRLDSIEGMDSEDEDTVIRVMGEGDDEDDHEQEGKEIGSIKTTLKSE